MSAKMPVEPSGPSSVPAATLTAVALLPDGYAPLSLSTVYMSCVWQTFGLGVTDRRVFVLRIDAWTAPGGTGINL